MHQSMCPWGKQQQIPARFLMTIGTAVGMVKVVPVTMPTCSLSRELATVIEPF
ncbi:MAG: hypothetical protein AAF151_12115 [Cyanobacteria bacterium J06656_5]